MDTKPHFVFEKGIPEQLTKLRLKSLFEIALRTDPTLQGRQELLLKVAEYQAQVPNLGDKEFDEFIQEAVAEYVRDVGILCLSETGSCPVMFYHYADAHRGVCMKFRADADYFAMAEQVMYEKDYPEIDYFADDDGTEFERIFLYSSVKVLARLHARGKPNVQTEKNVRVPGEADAETSLALVSTILLEIGWGVA